MSPEASPPGTEMVNESIDGQGRTGVIGKVTIKESGEAIKGAYVNIYPNTISNLLGPSQFISLPTDDSGRYSVDVPPGTYYVVARKRMSGNPTGPLSTGDYYSEHQRIVTTVRDGRLSVVDLEVAPMKAPMFFKKQVVERQTDTAISGRLVTAEGKPVVGGFAMAYSDPEMKRLPDYASTLSDATGNFTLYLPEGGSYYLAARIHAWDMPKPGEPYGIYGNGDPQLVTIDAGERIDDVVIRMSPFTGEYKPGKSRRPY
ncbi:MAG: carboxypeptidase regulatory-like domain-containing protein [Desulfuromonadales bacterium]|nr:carboxypeptidase regulatory-like domain-containing protein [Desulfuromonadales bacterium]